MSETRDFTRHPTSHGAGGLHDLAVEIDGHALLLVE
jgi:hypothetical protein